MLLLGNIQREILHNLLLSGVIDHVLLKVSRLVYTSLYLLYTAFFS